MFRLWSELVPGFKTLTPLHNDKRGFLILYIIRECKIIISGRIDFRRQCVRTLGELMFALWFSRSFKESACERRADALKFLLHIADLTPFWVFYPKYKQRQTTVVKIPRPQAILTTRSLSWSILRIL